MNDKNPEKQLIEKIRKVSNILVTVSRNPSVDQLASALALTIILDNIKKHATAVFSGRIPPVMNFLEPEKMFESNADSLRDFIISLDKNKADRLRMKTDGDIVKILVTPYRTKITPDDINFGEGEFNVELVIAIGAEDRTDLDQALIAHGRIFHDAVIATLNIDDGQDTLGSISWKESSANSYSELVTKIADGLSDENGSLLLDEQISTALLTGIVATTDQFRNEKTTPEIMKLSAELMANGANQQLIASELAAAGVEETDETETENSAPEEETNAESDDLGTLELRPAKSGNVEIYAGEPEAPENGTSEEIQNPVLEPVPTPDEQPEAVSDDRLKLSTERVSEEHNIDALEAAQAQLTESELNKSQFPPISQVKGEPIDETEAQLDGLVAQSGASNINDELRNIDPAEFVAPPPIEPEANPEYPAADYSPSQPVVDLPPLTPNQIVEPQIVGQAPVDSYAALNPAVPSPASAPLPPPPPLPMPDFHDMPPLEPQTTEPQSDPMQPNQTISPSDNSVIFPTVDTGTPVVPEVAPADPTQFQIPV